MDLDATPSQDHAPTDAPDALTVSIDPELFQALCDPVRIALVARLASANTALSVTEASECCGIHFSGVSRHLSILKRAGVVRAEKRGRENFYRLETRDVIAALRDVADALERCCVVDGACER